MAAALIHSDITLGSFTQASLREPSLLQLAKKIEFDSADAGCRQRAAAGEMTIVLSDGRALHHSVQLAVGDPKRPLRDAELRAKFIDCAARAARPMSRTCAEVLADRILSMEHESDVGVLPAAAL